MMLPPVLVKNKGTFKKQSWGLGSMCGGGWDCGWMGWLDRRALFVRRGYCKAMRTSDISLKTFKHVFLPGFQRTLFPQLHPGSWSPY